MKKVYREHKDNETSSEILTTLQVYAGKNHWHARPDVVVEYAATDDTLKTIPYIKVTTGGQTTEYFAEEVATPPRGPAVAADGLPRLPQQTGAHAGLHTRAGRQ